MVCLPGRQPAPAQRERSLLGTWVGFDIGLIVVLGRLGWLAYRRNPRVVLTDAAAATLLVTDAWFDVTTAASGSDRLKAILLELPTAALSGLLARRGLSGLVNRADDDLRTTAPSR